MSSQKIPMKLWPVMARWILANVAGWALGTSLGIFLTFAASQLNWVNEDRFSVYALLLSVGFACGIAQWVVIREYFPHSLQWISGTLAGYVLALLILQISNFARFGVTGLWGAFILFALMGAAIGIPQWWLLRQHFRGSGLWIFATSVGFLSFLWLVSNPANSQGNLILVATLLGAIAAAITGAALVRIVRQPRLELS